MKSMRNYICIIFMILFSIDMYSQELNCRIQINSQRIQGTNRQKFTNMRTAIYEFLNNTRWTNDIYSSEERIECNFIINLTSQIGTDGFTGSITVKSSNK